MFYHERRRKPRPAEEIFFHSTAEDREIVKRRQQKFFPDKAPLRDYDADLVVLALKTCGLWKKILAEEKVS